MKPTLVLLHGALGSKEQFTELASLLNNKFTIHTFNFEGHGGKPCDHSYSIELFTQNTLDYLEENNIEKALFFGFSMGGYVALNLSRKHPEKVMKIMTLGTKFHWTQESAAKEVQMLNPDKIEEKVPKFAGMLAQRHRSLDWKEVMRKTADMMLELGNGKALSPQQFASIQSEVLIALGEEDNMVTAGESRLIAEQLPNARFKIIPGFKHPVEQVDKKVLAKKVEQYLKY